MKDIHIIGCKKPIMRLLKTAAHAGGQALELQEFFDDAIPAYSILSHTWGDEEALFSDVINGSFKTKAGFRKIKGALERAREDGSAYLWVDTCR